MKKITLLLKEKMLLIMFFGLFTAGVQAQTVAIVGSTIGCIGDPKVLTVNITGPLSGPYTYAWTNGVTTATNTITNSVFLLRVTVTGTGANGNSQSVTSAPRIFIFFPKPVAAITANGPTTLCPGQSVTLNATGGNFFSSYLWNTGATTTSISVNLSGTYDVTITNLSGCSSVSNSIVVDVIDAGFSPVVTANGPLTFCQPGSVTLTAQSGFSSYLWTNGATTQSTTVTLVGTGGPILDTLSISCSVGINGACSFSSKTVVARAIREPELETPFCPNLNLTLSDTIIGGRVLSYAGIPPTYEFEFEETTNPGVYSVTANATRKLALANVTPALQIGKFYLVRERAVINGISYCYGNPCQIGITGPIAPPNDGQLARNSFAGNIQIGVFPNPSNDVFNVNVLTGTDVATTVKLMDVTGRVIEVAQLASGEKSTQVGKNIPAGSYLVQVSQGNSNSSVSRIVKTNQ